MIGSTWAGRVVVIAGAIVASAGGVIAVSTGGGRQQETATPTPSSALTCDRNATTGTFAAQVSAATAGQVVCLASGNYGTWTGPNADKGGITITAAAGASVTLGFDLGRTDNDQGFTIDGTGASGTISSPGGNILGDTVAYSTSQPNEPKNITFKHVAFTGATLIDGIYLGAIVFDNDTFLNINYAGTPSASSCGTETPAALHLAYGVAIDSGVTVKNSVFRGGNKDGIQTGTKLTIQDSEFDDIAEHNTTCADLGGASPHTDPIQCGGDCNGLVVTRNWVHNSADGIVAFDTIRNATITDNVVGPGQIKIDGIELYSDNSSTVQHNTLTAGLDLNLNHKTVDPAGTGTIVKDNIIPGGICLCNSGSGAVSAAAVNTNNMLGSGASSPNVNGTATFTGGATPSTYAGFRLTAGSTGHLGASDGLDVGIR